MRTYIANASYRGPYVSARPCGVRVADLTIHGVNNEKSAKAAAVAPRSFIGHEEGSEF